MKLFYIAVLLTVMQTPPPVPRKAPNSTDGTAQNVKKNANNNQAPAVPPPTAINPVTPKPEQNPSNPPSAKDAGQSISVSKLPAVSVDRNWADWVLWGFNGLLVIAGFLGIRVAYKTLKTIERQARSTHHQAVQVRKQTHLLNKSAEAAQKAAEAALLNAQAVIDSERAWLLVEKVRRRENMNSMDYYPVIANFGKTIARVKKVCGTGMLVAFDSILPEVPNFQDASVEEMNFVLYPKGEIDDALKITIDYDRVRDAHTGSFNLYLYGYIEYVDFAEKGRYSGFCVVLNVRNGLDFLPDTKCPSAYNKCT